VEIQNDSMKLNRSFARITRREGWLEGTVATKHGIVEVYVQGDAEFRHSSRLDFVHRGRLYMRTFSGKRYSPRGLVTKANQFAAEIVKETAQHNVTSVKRGGGA